MAHPLSLLFSGISNTARVGLSIASSGTMGRAALGAGIGGFYGASQGYDTNSRLEGFAKGALAGGVLGGVASHVPRAVFGKPGMSSKGMERLAMSKARKTSLGTGMSGPVSKQAYDTAMRDVVASGVGNRGAGLLPSTYRGAKKLWSANMAAGTRAAEKRARLMEFGNAKGIGPLPRELQPGRSAAVAASPLTKAAGGVGMAGMAALNNPMGLIGAGAAVMGAGYGISAMMRGRVQPMSSPQLEGARANISYDQQAMMTAQIGQVGGGTFASSDVMRQRFDYANWMATTGKTMMHYSRTARFAESTTGLNFGLHAGRHG